MSFSCSNSALIKRTDDGGRNQNRAKFADVLNGWSPCANIRYGNLKLTMFPSKCRFDHLIGVKKCN